MFVSNQEREIRFLFLFLFFEFQRNEIRKKRVKIRLSVHICKREAQPQDNIKRESTIKLINQNKTMSISARVKLDKCSKLDKYSIHPQNNDLPPCFLYFYKENNHC